MNYRYLLIFFFLFSCTNSVSKPNVKKTFVSKGFAYIYSDEDFNNKNISKKMNNNLMQVSHNKLRPGTLLKIVNMKTNESVVLKNSKKVKYPDFYKILITKPVAEQLKLQNDSPLVEIVEVKKNKSFIAKKTKIFKEEETIHSKAPIESVLINNISKDSKKKKKFSKDMFYILIAEFYSKNSANLLKKRITDDLKGFDSKKLLIKSKKTTKVSLLSGPYSSVNLMKNDYILLKKFGFEELDVNINE